MLLDNEGLFLMARVLAYCLAMHIKNSENLTLDICGCFLNWSKDIFAVPIFGSKKRSLKPRFCVALNIMAVDKIPANQPSLIKAFPKWIGPRDSCGVSYHALVNLKINWPAVTCFLGKRKTCLQ